MSPGFRPIERLARAALGAVFLWLAGAAAGCVPGAEAACIEKGGYPFEAGALACLSGASLNAAIEGQPGATPPANTDGGGPGYGFRWIDTTTNPNTIRQCQVSQCTGGVYHSAEWQTVGWLADAGAAYVEVPTAALVGAGGIGNALLANSGVTLNSHGLALGGSLTLGFGDFAGTIAAGQCPVATTGARGCVKADGTSIAVAGDGTLSAAASTVPRGYLAGLGLANDGVSPNSVLDIAAGMAADSTNATLIQAGAFTKSTAGAWAAGSGANGMGNGLTVAGSTWYTVCLANNGGAADYWFDISATCANRPAGISDAKYRRIGAIRTDGSAHIVAFSQNGDEFLWLAAVEDINTTSLGTTATLFTLTVPSGVKVYALLRGDSVTAGSAGFGLVNSPDETAIAGGSLAAWNANFVASTVLTMLQGLPPIRTNSSGQVRAVASTTVTLALGTYGYIDRRGRDN